MSRHLLMIAILFAGCGGPVLDPDTPEEPAPVTGSRYDPASCGTIAGRVIWAGEIPEVPAVKATLPLALGAKPTTQPNPNTPKIDPGNRAVAGAVVFVRGIDPQRAKPWDLPPARVALRDFRIEVSQGGPPANVGFVRRGDSVEFMSAQDVFHSLSVRGSNFFGLALPEAGRPATRRLDHSGLVELSSAAGYPWMRGYLFVGDAPYYARTDDAGRFVLSGVPNGAVEVVAWLPHWRFAGRDRDPNTGIEVRLRPAAPLEAVRPVTVAPGQTAAVELTLADCPIRFEAP